MPKVKAEKTATRTRRKPVVEEVYETEEVRVSSVLSGLAMVIAIIVAAAAWMGGSLSQIETRFANTVDSAARAAGLAVADVRVYGLEEAPELESLVRGAAMIEPGENMFRADPYVIRRRVERTERVLNVRVHRLWPGQLVILAEKADAAAMMETGGEIALYDALGRQISAAPEQSYDALIRLEGVGAPAALPRLLEALNGSPDLLSQIHAAKRVAGRRWTLVLRSGVEIRLPADEALDAAVARFETFEARTQATRRRVEAVDLRAPGPIFITPKRTIRTGGEA